MTRLHIWPTPNEIQLNNGIGRVVHAQYRYLPSYDFEFVDALRADVLVGHTQQHDMPRIDALHCHGMYWTGDPGTGAYTSWHNTVNKKIIDAARKSRVFTVPSKWVAETFKREMRIVPEIVGHGINFEEWIPDKNMGYLLWNKNRDKDVCNPMPAYEMALRGFDVVSTFAPSLQKPPTLRVTNVMSHEYMREMICHADLYLATTKETFGIGTLEAMAAGVPILGYHWGGTAELVDHMVTGYLVEPGDFDGLAEGVHWLREHRKAVSEAAREFASHMDWPQMVKQYAELYHGLEAPEPELKVTVVIPCYNYGRFLHEAVGSCMFQETSCEVIVVDDGSTDNTRELAVKLQEHYGKERLQLIFQENQGVAAARNHGIAVAKGDLIIALDADDQLEPNYVSTLLPAFEKDRGLGIAYTGLLLIDTAGRRQSINYWPPQFNWERLAVSHNPPSNCIPSAAMFRKELWRRCGGYHQRYAPAEDVEFWVRGLSLGWTATRVTDDPLFVYRVHRDGASHVLKYQSIDPYLPWMHDKQFPIGSPAQETGPVRSYTAPVISIIIPVGPGHENLVADAVESVIGQSLRETEIIVAWDSNLASDVLEARFPFAKFVYLGSWKSGPGTARNLGLEHATADLCLFLDADDVLAPGALAVFVRTYAKSEGRYVYSHWTDESGKTLEVPIYNPKAILNAPQHAVTVLMATEQARRIRFDETLKALEDWDFFARCAIEGIHGVLEPQVLIQVRKKTGGRTRKLRDDKDLLKQVRSRYTAYAEGETEMGSCCGGDVAAPLLAAKVAMGLLPPQAGEHTNGSGGNGMPDNLAPGKVRMEFIGPTVGAITYGGVGVTPSGRSYRGGNNMMHRFVDADEKDVNWLEGLGVWRAVMRTKISAERPTRHYEPKADAPVTPEPEVEIPPEIAMPAPPLTGAEKRLAEMAMEEGEAKPARRRR